MVGWNDGTNCVLPTDDCPLATADLFLTPHALHHFFPLLTANYQLATATGDCPPPTSSSRLMPHAFFCSLMTANCQLATATGDLCRLIPHASCLFFPLLPDYFPFLTLFFIHRFSKLLTLKFYFTFAAWQIMKIFLKN